MKSARSRTPKPRTLSALLALMIVALGTPGGAGAKPKPPPTFVDGAWKGTVTGGGNISFGDAVASGIGDATFTLVVDEGKVIKGSMASEGVSFSDVPGATAGLAFEFKGELKGEATTVTWAGTAGWQGSVVTELLGAVPVGGSGPGYGEFSPATATCSKVTGDFAAYGRGLQQAAGAATNVKAIFIAVRDQSAEAEAILQEYSDLLGEITVALGEPGSNPVQTVLNLIERVTALQKHINDLKACGALPPGIQQGQADPHFSDLFRQLIDSVLENPDQLETSQLVAILYAAFQTGAVGASSPDQAAAEETLGQLLDVLFARVDVHAQEGDDAALIQIYLAAQQLGLTDLAAYAKAKLDG
ncbi:MAG: hypothetical protein ACRDHM_03315 [Actinomycetota bacterium]